MFIYCCASSTHPLQGGNLEGRVKKGAVVSSGDERKRASPLIAPNTSRNHTTEYVLPYSAGGPRLGECLNVPRYVNLWGKFIIKVTLSPGQVISRVLKLYTLAISPFSVYVELCGASIRLQGTVVLYFAHGFDPPLPQPLCEFRQQ